jgi:hypothetical protein
MLITHMMKVEAVVVVEEEVVVQCAEKVVEEVVE